MNEPIDEPLKIAIIGCGRIAQAYLHAIHSFPHARIAALVDVDPDARQRIDPANKYPFFICIEEFLSSSEADCCIICTPPLFHAEIACKMLDRGLHVLCEKPFAIELYSSLAMLESAQRNKKHLIVASKFRFVNEIVVAKSMMDAGILGDILVYENSFSYPIDMRSRWNSVPHISGGGVLIDNGSHSVDIARYLLGDIFSIRAEEARRIQSPSVEDTVQVSLKTESGTFGTINLSWTIQGVGDEYIRIFGTHGSLCIGWKRSRYQPAVTDRWIEFGSAYDRNDVFRLMVGNFIDVASGSAGPRASAFDGVEAVRAIATAYESLQTGQWVKLHPMPQMSFRNSVTAPIQAQPAILDQRSPG